MLDNEPNRIDMMHERQKQRNDKSKYWAAVIGQNMSLAVCLMIPAFLVTLVWTDTSLPKLGMSLGMETLLTAALFIIAEWASINVGIPSGKLDDEYIAIQQAFLKRVAQIKAKGILKMSVFCEWQIDEELMMTKKAMCRKLKLDWNTYQTVYARMDQKELIQACGKVKGLMIHRINELEPIELTPELILGENRRGQRGGISVSGDDYVNNQKYGGWNLAKSVLTIVLTVGIGFSLSPGVTWGKIVFTIYRLIAVFIRMKVGFDKGAKAFNQIEVRHRESQIYYMDRYDEFLGTAGLYESAMAKYGSTISDQKEADVVESTTLSISECQTADGPGEGTSDREFGQTTHVVAVR